MYAISSHLIAKNSGLLLNVSGAGQERGAPVIQWRASGTDNEVWDLTPTGDGFFNLIARHSGQALNVEGGSLENGARIIQWPVCGTDNEKWRLVPSDDGFFKLIAKHSGKALNVADASSESGASVIQWPISGTDNEKWNIVSLNSKLIGCKIAFRTTSDDKDGDTGVTVIIRDSRGFSIAAVSKTWGHFDDNTSNGPFDVDVDAVRNATKYDVISGSITIGITPQGIITHPFEPFADINWEWGGDDEWRFNFVLSLEFDDGSCFSVGRNGLHLEGDHKLDTFAIANLEWNTFQ